MLELTIPSLDSALPSAGPDGLSLVMAAAIVGIGVLSLVFSSGRRPLGWVAWQVGYVLTSLMAVLVADLLALLIFWELMSVAAYFLIVSQADDAGRAAGRRYLIAHLAGGAALLMAVLLQYDSTGSLWIGPAAARARPFFALACGIKAALLPLHFWMTDTYPKADLDSAVVLSACTTKVGVYVIARTMHGPPLVWLGAAMALVGVVAALLQSNARKLLAYHIVSQVGYMVAAIGVGSALGRDAGIFHAVNNIAYKSLLFMVVGAVILRAGTDDLKSLGGLARSMPVTFACCILASLAISGTPLFNGYASKLLISQALTEGGYRAAGWALGLASVGTCMSFTKLIYYTFLRSGREARTPGEVPPPMLVSMLILGGLCIALGLAPGLATRWLPGVPATFGYLQWGAIAKALGAVAVGIVLFWTLGKRLPRLDRDVFDLIPGWRALSRVHRRLCTAADRVLEADVQLQLAWVFALAAALFWFLIGR